MTATTDEKKRMFDKLCGRKFDSYEEFRDAWEMLDYAGKSALAEKMPIENFFLSADVSMRVTADDDDYGYPDMQPEEFFTEGYSSVAHLLFFDDMFPMERLTRDMLFLGNGEGTKAFGYLLAGSCTEDGENISRIPEDLLDEEVLAIRNSPLDPTIAHELALQGSLPPRFQNERILSLGYSEPGHDTPLFGCIDTETLVMNEETKKALSLVTYGDRRGNAAHFALENGIFSVCPDLPAELFLAEDSSGIPPLYYLSEEETEALFEILPSDTLRHIIDNADRIKEPKTRAFVDETARRWLRFVEHQILDLDEEPSGEMDSLYGLSRPANR